VGKFGLSKRDLLVLFGFLWAAALLYCCYMLVAKVQGIRRQARIDADRTANDIVIDNSEQIYIALLNSANQADGAITKDLEQLVESGHLSEVPINPFTGSPIEIIRIGDDPMPGNMSIVTGWAEAGADDGSEYRKYEQLIVIAYGKPELGYTKYRERIFAGRNNFNALFGPRLPEEIDRQIVFMDGGLGSPGGKVSAGYYVKRQTLEEAMLEEGYSLPLRFAPDNDG
jgi:hypothetical protein